MSSSKGIAKAIETRIRFLLDGTTTVLFVGDGIGELLGFNAEDFLTGRQSFTDLIHGDDRDIADELFSTDTTRTAGTFNIRLRQANGRIRCVAGHYAREPDASGAGRIHLELLLQDAKRLGQHQGKQPLMANFVAMMENTNDYIYFKDRNHVFTGASQTLVAITDPSEHWTDLLGQTDYDVFPEEYADIYYRLEKQVFAGIPVAHEIQETLDNAGRKGWVDNRKYPIRDASGEIIGLFGIARDITEQKLNEARLRLAASVFSCSQEGIIITDAHNRIIEVNPAFSQITGYGHDEVLGKDPRILNSGQHPPTFFAEMWQSLAATGSWQGEVWNRHKSGDVYPQRMSIDTVRDADGTVAQYVVVFSDISQLKEHQAELDHIAHYDALTGVPNRRLLDDRLDQAIARARRSGKSLAVCYLDLDAFKPVNDAYGHAAGDRLLVEITGHLRKVLRGDDTIARLGGDEFVLLFTDLDKPQEVNAALDRVLAAVSAPVWIDSTSISISASIGATLYPADDADADTLLRHADQAMYQAKEAGRNRYHLFDPKHDSEIRAHRSQLERLGRALKNGEFVLHYQPKVDLVSGEVTGAEALIRWQHPEQGLLPPAAFLHDLEGGDLEIAVGEWVIDTVLGQIAAWQAGGLRLKLSANVSAHHLLQGDFPDRLRLALERHPEVAPGDLELEILETAALADTDLAAQILGRCRELGVSFALDDFGTGYSSLAYFRRLPVDMLKIDQSFVRDMLVDAEDLGIVESVVRLAHAFNRPVIAEGVETLEHGAVLIDLGCRLAQGYGIARPMPAADFPGWAAQWREQAAWLALSRRLPAREDLTLLVAAHSHNVWIDSLVEHLAHPGKEFTGNLDSHHCHFGHWYHGNGAIRFGRLPEFLAIDPWHERVHRLGAEMVALARDGKNEVALQRLPELYETRDNLLMLIEALIEKAENPVEQTPA